MTPAALRAIFGSCLALGFADLAWLDLNAGKMAKELGSPSMMVVESAPSGDQPPVMVRQEGARAAATAPPVVTATGVTASTQAVTPEQGKGPPIAVPSTPNAPPLQNAPMAANTPSQNTAPAAGAAPSVNVPSAAAESPAAAAAGPSKQDEASSICIVQFDRSLSVLRPEQAAQLASIAQALKDNPRAMVRIGGHADRVAWKGNRGDNMTLSENRAGAVARALAKLGIPPDRIRRTAFGDSRPVDDRSNEEAYRRNRRVEVRVELTGDH